MNVELLRVERMNFFVKMKCSCFQEWPKFIFFLTLNFTHWLIVDSQTDSFSQFVVGEVASDNALFVFISIERFLSTRCSAILVKTKYQNIIFSYQLIFLDFFVCFRHKKFNLFVFFKLIFSSTLASHCAFITFQFNCVFPYYSTLVDVFLCQKFITCFRMDPLFCSSNTRFSIIVYNLLQSLLPSLFCSTCHSRFFFSGACRLLHSSFPPFSGCFHALSKFRIVFLFFYASIYRLSGQLSSGSLVFRS